MTGCDKHANDDCINENEEMAGFAANTQVEIYMRTNFLENEDIFL